MTFDEYQRAAERTMRLKELSRHELVLHSLWGMCSESGEVAGLYQKSLQGHPIDLEHLKKEPAQARGGCVMEDEKTAGLVTREELCGLPTVLSLLI